MNFQNCFVDFEAWVDNGTYLYHYTSVENAKKIFKSEKIIAFPSLIEAFGVGVFLTPISPRENDEVIHRDLFGIKTNNYKEKIQCCFAFSRQDIQNLEDLSSIDLQRHFRRVFKSTKDVELNEIKFSFILRPCSNTNTDGVLASLNNL
jgi:hypothetical protein